MFSNLYLDLNSNISFRQQQKTNKLTKIFEHKRDILESKMRSPYHSRPSRDYYTHSKSRNNRSASPSPPRPTEKNLKSIRITIANVPGKPLSGSQVSSKWTLFLGMIQ